MTHKWRPGDVEAALQRYRDLTGDTDASLHREEAPLPGRRGPPNPAAILVIWRVENSRYFRSFMAVGNREAVQAIALFCDGWEGGAGPHGKPPK